MKALITKPVTSENGREYRVETLDGDRYAFHGKVERQRANRWKATKRAGSFTVEVIGIFRTREAAVDALLGRVPAEAV
jgi:hypothetical protein